MGDEQRFAGHRGERLASLFLASRGCRVIGRNLRRGPDEIDLLVVDRGERVAVEVKYTSCAGAEPLEGVDDAKFERLCRALASVVPPVQRIDLVGIVELGGAIEIRWLVAVSA